MKQTDDRSLFAWVDTDAAPDAIHGLLAKSPYFFRHSNTIVPYHDWEPRKPFSTTNRGLCIDLPLTRNDEDIYVAALDCPAPPDFPESSFLAIYLQVLSVENKQYARVRAGIFGKVYMRGIVQTIYVRQTPAAPLTEGVFPWHLFQLRKGPSPVEYCVESVILAPEGSSTLMSDLIKTSRAMCRQWLPEPWPVSMRVPRREGQLSGVVTFRRDDGYRLAVMLGSAAGSRGGGFSVGFDAIELEDGEEDLDPVPLLDMLRYNKLLAGASWVAEYGDPDKPDEWSYIQNFSPYQNVKKGVDYPPVLFYTATSDDRVGPVQARKMAAKMKESLGYSNVWFYENTEGGHGAAADNKQSAFMHALAYSFLWDHLAQAAR